MILILKKEDGEEREMGKKKLKKKKTYNKKIALLEGFIYKQKWLKLTNIF